MQINKQFITLQESKMSHSRVKIRMFSGANLLKPACLLVILLIAITYIQPSAGIFNCFGPNAYKVGKGGGSPMFTAAGWYPQQQQSSYPMSYGSSPMRNLLQPRWKSGSLLGTRMWASGWKMGNNFYRPGSGYSYGIGNSYPHSVPLSAGSFHFNEPLNLAYARPLQPGTYSSSLSDGWSLPVETSSPIQQTSVTSYDSAYTKGPTVVTPSLVSPPVDRYTATTLDIKGGSKLKDKYTSTSSTTKSNVLLADGGYNSFDAVLANKLLTNSSYGYSYPDWYTGTYDSPSKRAQQLVREGFRNQRLQQQWRDQLQIHKIVSGESPLLWR